MSGSQVEHNTAFGGWVIRSSRPPLSGRLLYNGIWATYVNPFAPEGLKDNVLDMNRYSVYVFTEQADAEKAMQQMDKRFDDYTPLPPQPRRRFR